MSMIVPSPMAAPSLEGPSVSLEKLSSFKVEPSQSQPRGRSHEAGALQELLHDPVVLGRRLEAAHMSGTGNLMEPGALDAPVQVAGGILGYEGIVAARRDQDGHVDSRQDLRIVRLLRHSLQCGGVEVC